MTKISVIIPIYNVEMYLRECLESVINQSFNDIEVLCIDDSGTDSSIKIAENYAKKDNRIKIIRHESNKGLAVARNTGLESATGDYIFFLDSDDYIVPDALEKLYEKAKNECADITLSKIEAFADNDTKEIQKRTQTTNDNLISNLIGTFQITPENYISMATNLSVMSWGKLFSAKFLKSNKLMFIDKNVIHEDVGFWLKCCSCFPKIVSIEDIGVMYRIRSCSIMSGSKRKKSKHDLILNLKNVFEYYDESRTSFSKELKEQVKNNECFSFVFNKQIGFLCRWHWFKDSKLIKILGIPLYSNKLNKKNKRIIKIIGIPIYYK